VFLKVLTPWDDGAVRSLQPRSPPGVAISFMFTAVGQHRQLILRNEDYAAAVKATCTPIWPRESGGGSCR